MSKQFRINATLNYARLFPQFQISLLLLGVQEALQLIPNGRHGARCGCTSYGVSGEDTNKEFLRHYCGGRGEFKHEFCVSDTGPSILYKTNSGRGPSQKMEQIGTNKPKKTYNGHMQSQDYC